MHVHTYINYVNWVSTTCSLFGFGTRFLEIPLLSGARPCVDLVTRIFASTLIFFFEMKTRKERKQH